MTFLLILIISLLLQILLPWYSIALVAFVISYWKAKSAAGAFFQAFLAIAVLWGSYAGYQHSQSEGILSEKIAPLFFLPFPELLILVTMLIGGLVAGLAGLTGFYAKASLVTVKNKRSLKR